MQIPRHTDEENGVCYIICAVPEEKCSDAGKDGSEEGCVVPNGAFFEIWVFEDNVMLAPG
jgi:hypothetical protein